MQEYYIFSPCTLRTWDFKWLDWLDRWSQYWQAYAFSPVCTLKCLLMFFVMTFLKQIEHLDLPTSSGKLSWNTVNSRFKKDLKLQIHLHKASFTDDRFLDSLHKSFLNQTTLDLRKEKWTFLNREFTVLLNYLLRSNWFWESYCFTGFTGSWWWNRTNHTSYRTFYFNEFVANVLHENNGMIIFEAVTCQ